MKFLRIIVILEFAAIVMLSLARISRSVGDVAEVLTEPLTVITISSLRMISILAVMLVTNLTGPLLCMRKVNSILTTNMMWVRIHMMLVSIDGPHLIMVGNVQCRVTQVKITHVGGAPPSPKMPTFNGNSTDDWVAYHVQFERIAKTYGWDIETKLEKLIESLRGKAASYFGRLPELDRENYEIL